MWWRRTRTFFQCCPITARVFASYPPTELFEQRVIVERQTELNAPYVNQLINERKGPTSKKHSSALWATQFRSKSTKSTAKLINKARKLRRRGFTGAWLQYVPASWNNDENARLWATLLALATKGQKAWEVESRLRSTHKTSNVEMFLLHRMSRKMEQPKRSVIQSRLARILKSRDLVNPGPRYPLVTPLLPTRSYKGAVRDKLKELVQQARHGCPPLHTPPLSLVAPKWKPIQEALHNHRAFMDNAQPHTLLQTSCACKNIRLSQEASSNSTTGHVILAGHEFTMVAGLPAAAKTVAALNTCEIVLPKKLEYQRRVHGDIAAYLRKTELLPASLDGTSAYGGTSMPGQALNGGNYKLLTILVCSGSQSSRKVVGNSRRRFQT